MHIITERYIKIPNEDYKYEPKHKEPEHKSSEQLMQEIKVMFDNLKNENDTLKFENAQLKGKLNNLTFLGEQKGSEQFHKIAVTCFSIDDLANMYENALLHIDELDKIIDGIKRRRHRRTT